jgi:hypothetical protein
MSLTKRLGLIVGAAASVSSAMAQTALDQSRAYQNELFSDASRQVSQQGAAAFTAKGGGYLQFRYNYNQRDDTNLDKDGAIGFQMARARLNVGGNVFNEDWGYFIQFGWSDDTSVVPPPAVTTPPTPGNAAGSSTSSGTTFLEDAYGTYKIGNGWGLKFGQFKLPFMKEQLVGDTAQLAMDRSMMDDTFSQERSQGIQAGFEQESWRMWVAFSDGIRSADTDFVAVGEADFALTGRGEFMWAGKWADADQFTSWQNSSFFGMVGGAAHWQTGGGTFNVGQAAVPPGPQADVADADLFGATVDVMVKGNGWNAFAAAIYMITDPGSNSVPGAGTVPYPGTGTPGGAAASTQGDFAIMAQGGIFVAPQWELFGRAEFIKPDSSRTPAGSPVKFDEEMFGIAGGVNYYISPDSQAAKFTAQLHYMFEQQSAGIVSPDTQTGILGSNDKPQFTVSAQIQLVF